MIKMINKKIIWIMVMFLVMCSFTIAETIEWDTQETFNEGVYFDTLYYNGLVLHDTLTGRYCSNINTIEGQILNWINFTNIETNIDENLSYFVNQTAFKTLKAYESDTTNITSIISSDDGVYTSEINVDAINKAIKINGNFTNNDVLYMEFLITDGEENNIYLHNLDGSVVYGNFTPAGVKDLYYNKSAVLSNVNGVTDIYMSDLDIGIGGTKLLIDHLYINYTQQIENFVYVTTTTDYEYRTCDNEFCINESFIPVNLPQEINATGDYFQFCVDLESNVIGYSPTITNVSISYEFGEARFGCRDITAYNYDPLANRDAYCQYVEPVKIGECPSTERGQKNLWIGLLILIAFGMFGLMYSYPTFTILSGFMLIIMSLTMWTCSNIMGIVFILFGLVFIFASLRLKDKTM